MYNLLLIFIDCTLYIEYNNYITLTGYNYDLYNKKFKLHPKFIVNAIEQQANGLPKAIVELIMNSIDANATQINIKLWLNAKNIFSLKLLMMEKVLPKIY